ncbi:MAG: fimbria/pilus outer membrane usher protein [Thiobacillus sp.]|jgi:outer membrane usher protein|uniref:fimbria/pilus outer membrane usher protein n=1 Tax=Thiobacillus sp. TaxID=924 RepID=UPI002894C76C|nr:fimbria/pilus outer membrane usher protein [Thiobacillus sp.]MDT3705953.1 fimbria/pilus outer membrane usher protein [Thiobacillus sp.]
MSFVIPLDNRVNVSGNLTNRDGQVDSYVAASRGLTAETGTGWRVLGGSRTGATYSEGGFYYQGSKGLLTADASASVDQKTLRVGAQGGVVAIDGRLFASRTVQDSFALVEVPGYADVGVGFQGSKLTRTDEDGIALLPRLQPFQNNSIRLDPSELPISAELDSIEQVVVPAWRSAVKVAFPVRAGRGALVTLVLDDGEPAPAGAEVELAGDDEAFFVARRGEAFITGLQARNEIRLKWNDASCTIVIELPPGAVDEIARIGPLKCSGVKR